jgi:membrane associated rhomboid family serine protease
MARRAGMKTIRNSLIFALFVVAGTALQAGTAMAVMDMPEKETVQAIAWAVEIVAFIMAVAIAWYILRLVKRDSKNIKSKKDSS